jgi:acyl dehydratase
MLYALGVGAGTADPTGFELEFTTQNSAGVALEVLPTFPVVIRSGGNLIERVGEFDRAKLVHGEQSVTLHSVLPVAGSVTSVSQLTGVYDKGSGAVITTERVATDTESGAKLFTTSNSAFIRGEGGFGGARGPANQVEIPSRAPDRAITYHTRPDQALLYRLSGDFNPLHSDPAFAARAGFDKPILHGLCSFGFAGRALLHSVCDSNVHRFRSISCRFTKPVLPGEPLHVAIWLCARGETVFRVSTERGVVIDSGQFSYDA